MSSNCDARAHFHVILSRVHRGACLTRPVMRPAGRTHKHRGRTHTLFLSITHHNTLPLKQNVKTRGEKKMILLMFGAFGVDTIYRTRVYTSNTPKRDASASGWTHCAVTNTQKHHKIIQPCCVRCVFVPDTRQKCGKARVERRVMLCVHSVRVM